MEHNPLDNIHRVSCLTLHGLSSSFTEPEIGSDVELLFDKAASLKITRRYFNGGSLKHLIKEHFDYVDEASGQTMRRNVPEHFIWHVAEQIGEALVYMHLGWPRGTSGPNACEQLPDWKPIYHRDISDSNIYLHYQPTAGSELEMHRNRAFPRVVLGDWGEAAIDGDDPATFVRWYASGFDNKPGAERMDRRAPVWPHPQAPMYGAC